MHRITISLNDEQHAALAARAAAEGISAAALVRRLIDQALVGTPDDLAGDLAAIDASFGALRDDGMGIDVDRADGQRGAPAADQPPVIVVDTAVLLANLLGVDAAQQWLR